MESLGQYLRAERERRKISLDEISYITKISSSHLLALEEDKYQYLPHQTFVRGFIKAYCECIGLDVQATLQHFDSFLKEKNRDRPTYDSLRRWKKKLIYSIGIVVSLGVIIFFLYPWSTYYYPREDIPSSAPALREKLIERKSGGNPPPSADYPPPLSLIIKTRRPNYLKVQIDENPVQELMLREMDIVSFLARVKIDLVIHDINGVEIIYNGEPVRQIPVGRKDKVVHLSFP